MRVLVYGAGRFGRTIAEGFAGFSDAVFDVAVADRRGEPPDGVPADVRFTPQPMEEKPEVLVLSASAVPMEERERLLDADASIERFWDLERQYNLAMMQRLLPWVARTQWKLLIVATNPVDEWVNALRQILPGRSIVGLGTAFDSQRMRHLAAAMFPGDELSVLRHLRIVGGHGTAIGIGKGGISPDVLETAKWMSNALSIDFIRAPGNLSRAWWTRVAIAPLVRGLAGKRTRTHLVIPIEFAGISVATGTDVWVRELDIRPFPLGDITDEEHERLARYLQERYAAGISLAENLKVPEPARLD